MWEDERDRPPEVAPEVRQPEGLAAGGPEPEAAAGGDQRSRLTPQEIDALGDEITQLAGQIAAATARFLRLLGEFDASGGWGGVGIRSLAHWLSWRAGMSLRTARDHVRVARALRDLPLTAAAFAHGELSFSKVRALTRVATRATERELVAIATNAPAAHVERLVAGLRKVRDRPPQPRPAPTRGMNDDGGGCDDRDSSEDDQPGHPEPDPSERARQDSSQAGDRPVGEGPAEDDRGGEHPAGEEQDDDAQARGEQGSSDEQGSVGDPPVDELGGRRSTRPAQAPAQHLQWRWDEDSDELVVWGRFGAADGKVLLAALTRTELERVRTLAHEQTPESEASAGQAGPEASGPEASGTGGAGTGEAGSAEAPAESVDRTAPPPLEAGPALVALAQIGLLAQSAPAYAPAAEVIFLHQESDATPGCSAEHRPGLRDQAGQASGVVSADEGPALDECAGEEVLCDSPTRCVAQGAGGAVLAYGRRRRSFSAAQLRSLHLRDRCCRTPGCQRTRFLHAHHVAWWSRGGLTDLDNAILLCSACHRAVHLGRLLMRALGGQRFEFREAQTGEVLVDAPPMFGLADQILADRTIRPRTITGGWEGEPLDLSEATASLIAGWKVRGAWPTPPGAPLRAWDDRPSWLSDAAA